MAYEIEVVGGVMARYLAKFTRRQFRTARAAAEYAARIRSVTDENGTTACHQIIITDPAGHDISGEAFALLD